MDFVEKLNNDISYICTKTTQINAYIVFYKQLIEINHETPDKYAKSPNFFNSVTLAYDYGIVCNLFNILDKKGQEGNIYLLFENIVKIIRKRDNVSLNRLEKCSEILDQIDSQKKSIVILRNKIFAHTDRLYYINHGLLFKKGLFDLEYFEELNLKIVELLSELYSLLNNESWCYNPNILSGYDLYNLIKD